MLGRQIVLSFAGLTLVAAALAYQASSPREAVRLRNSLLASTGPASDLLWSPPAVPDGFLQNSRGPSEFFRARAAEIQQSPKLDFDTGRAIAAHLIEGHRRGLPIQASTEQTYRTIRERGIGYCADFTQTFNALALAAGIGVREWGVSFDGFGGDGHAFNEFYDAQLGQWVMVDSFHAFYPSDSASGRPLSALEFIQRLRNERPLATMTIMKTDPEQFGFPNDQRLISYYRQGTDQFYLWWGNNVFDYDSHPLVATAGRLSRSLEQLIAILLGVHPRIRIIDTPDNGDLVQALMIKRWTVLLLLSVGLILSLRLAYLLFKGLFAWRQRAAHN